MASDQEGQRTDSHARALGRRAAGSASVSSALPHFAQSRQYGKRDAAIHLFAFAGPRFAERQPDLTVRGDRLDAPPTIFLSLLFRSHGSDRTGTSTVIVQVHAVDNVAIAESRLRFNGQFLPPDAWWRYEFTSPAPGLYTFTAAFTDTGGHDAGRDGGRYPTDEKAPVFSSSLG
jgi:hypothetical protein